MTKRAGSVNIKPNSSLSYEHFRELNKNWQLGIVDNGRKQEFKNNVIKRIETLFSFPAYVKLYFYLHKNHVYALPGAKPTKKVTATPVGIQTIKNIAKETPKAVLKYLNTS